MVNLLNSCDTVVFLSLIVHHKPHSFNPERLTDNGTLDTFLHMYRVWLEIMSEHKHKQNKSDNLTRKERQALNQLINNPILVVINKADKESTIVVQDRSEYIAEAMKHLNDQTTYKPLKENITYKLKDLILELLLKNGFFRKPQHQFCKPPIKHRTSKLYFLKKIHKNSMGIRPIVSSCDSITEKVSQFVDKILMATTICEKSTLICQRYNRIY